MQAPAPLKADGRFPTLCSTAVLADRLQSLPQCPVAALMRLGANTIWGNIDHDDTDDKITTHNPQRTPNDFTPNSHASHVRAAAPVGIQEGRLQEETSSGRRDSGHAQGQERGHSFREGDAPTA